MTRSRPHRAGRQDARGRTRPQKVESDCDPPTSSGVRASVVSIASTMKVIVKASTHHSACVGVGWVGVWVGGGRWGVE